MIKSCYQVKGQRKFILVVKSQSKYLVGQHFDRGRRSVYRCKGTDYEMDHETEKERVHVSSHEADDYGRTELI